jgi:citrate synthase
MATNTSQPQGVLHVTDSRTGRAYELPIADGAIRAIDLRQIKASDDDFGLLSYDPGFMNTANCRSAITYIDGRRGYSGTGATRSRNSPGASASWTSPPC